jgi:hypothetical protein
MTTDENNVVAQPAVDETTQANPPQAEAPVTQEQTTQTIAESAQANDELPADTEEQRRAFQEMRKELKQLKEEREARQHSESAFEVFKPKSQTQFVDRNQFTNPDTGETNEYAYQNALIQHARAEGAAASREELDEFRARQKHAELFKDSSFEEDVAARWAFAKLRGENLTISDVADRVASRYTKAVSKAEKIGAEKMLEEVSVKEQAGVTASSQNTIPARQAQETEELERLRRQSRGRGRESDEAIVARLKHVPYE